MTTVRIAATVLMAACAASGETGTGKPPAPVDLYGDPLPAGAVARCGTARFRHGATVRCLAWSPDGRIIASGGQGWTSPIRLWDARTGKQIRSLPGQGEIGTYDATWSVAFSPDGKRLASIESDKKVRIRDLATGKVICEFGLQGIHTDRVARHPLVAFGADGETVILPDGRHDVKAEAAGKGKGDMQGSIEKPWIVAITLSRDGSRMAFLRKRPGFEHAEAGFIEVQDMKSGRGRSTKELRVACVALSGDGKLAAGGEMKSPDRDSRVLLFDTESMRQVGALPGHKRGVEHMALSDDGGLVASSGGDGDVRVWDAGKQKQLWQVRVADVRAMAFSPDGRTLGVADYRGVVRLFATADGAPRPVGGGHTGCVFSGALSPDGGTLATGGSDNAVLLWDARTGRPLGRCDGHTKPVVGLDFSPDAKTLVSVGWQSIRLWRADSREPIRVLGGPKGTWRGGRFSPDGSKLVAIGRDGRIVVWDVKDGRELFAHAPEQRGWCHTSAIAPDAGLVAYLQQSMVELGSSVAPSEGPPLKLFDVALGRVRAEFRDWTWPLCFSPHADLITRQKARAIELVEISSGLRVLSLSFSKWHDGDVTAVAWCGRSGRIATGGRDGTICLWDPATGRMLHKFDGHWGEVCAMTFSRDGTVLASASTDATALLWSMAAVPSPAALPKPDAKGMQVCWEELASRQPDKAYRAAAALAAAGDAAVDFLAGRLRPATAADAKRVEALIRDLDSAEYAARERASAELEKLGSAAVDGMRKALKTAESPEVRSRLEALLKSASASIIQSPAVLRELRSVTALERVGTEKARTLLKRLVGGLPGAPVTRAAAAALRRAQQACSPPDKSG